MRRSGIVQSGNPLRHIGARGKYFDPQRTLPRRWQRLLRRQHCPDALLQSQAYQPGGSKDDGIVLPLVELAQTCIEVATQRLDLQLRILRSQNRFAAQAGGSHHGPRRQFVKRRKTIGNQSITWILARRDGRQGKALGHLHRHILERMHRQVGAPFLHGDLKLLDEQSFATDLRQRAIENLIAAGCHPENVDHRIRIQGLQTPLNMPRLPHGQTRFTRSDNDTRGGGTLKGQGGFPEAKDW